MFKGRATRKALIHAMKKSPSKDATGWCSKNLPCPEDDRPGNVVTEFSGQPVRMTQREVNMLGVMPFAFDGKDLSEWVLDFLDVRRVTLDPVQKLLVQRDVSFVRATLVRTSFRGSVCSRTSFERANAELASFNSAVLIFCSFDGAVLRRATFVAANLEHAHLRDVVAPAANFTHANLEHATLTESWFCSREHYKSSADKSARSEYSLAMWAGASFVNAKLKGADFRGAKLCGCDLSGANLSCANLQNADLRGANLTGAKLCGANLIHADLTGVRGLDKADLTWAVVVGGVTIDQDLEAHKDASKILMSRSSVERWALELSEVNFSSTDLSDLSLPGCKLVGCLFRGCDLRHTNLGGANLTGADLSFAELFNADLSGAILFGARFTGADMRNTNLSGVDLMQIKDSLLEAKTLAGMTCTMGMVPEELKARGVLDSGDKGSVRVNTQALEAAEQRIREERKLKLEAEKRQKAIDAEQASIDRLENVVATTSFSHVSARDLPLLRLRLLATVLKERTLNLTPTTQEERDERWAAFNETFGMARGSPTLKKLYLMLIGEEVHDEWIVVVWRRTKDIKSPRMGTLENMALEAMLRARDWNQWAPDVYRTLAEKERDKNFAPEYTMYLQILFKSRAAEQAISGSPTASMSSPAPTSSAAAMTPIPPELSPDEFVPPPPGDPTETSPVLGTSQQSPLVQHRASIGRTGGSMRSAAPPMSSPLSIPVSLAQSAAASGPAPMPSPTSGGSQRAMGGPLGPMMQPPGMAAPQPPTDMAPQAPNGGGSPVLMQQQQQQQQQQMMMMGGGFGIQQPMGSMLGMQQPMGVLGAQQPMMGVMGGGYGGLGMQQPMMGVMSGGYGGLGMQPMGVMGGVGSVGSIGGGMPPGMVARSPLGMVRSPAPVARVKCVECGMVLDANYIQAHKRECRMRFVSCAQCRFTMRYCQWDNHNRFCGTAGPCPICGRQVRDNIVVHLFEKHIPELAERGFFCGAEPPTRIQQH